MEKSTTKKTKKTLKNVTNLSNKKHQDNKTIKARNILEKNKEALHRAKEIRQNEQLSPARKVFRTIKNIVLSIVIIILAIVIVSFIIVKFNGGTPTVFGYSIQRIVSGSMEPELSVGNIILSKTVEDPESVSVGDIVTYRGGSRFDFRSVTHRVVTQPMLNSDGVYVLVTKGDANADVDPEIKFSDVESVFVKKLEMLDQFYNFFLSPWGLILFIAALLAIFFDELMTVIRALSGRYDEEEDENIGEIMTRLKQEDVEKFLRLERKKAKRLKKPHKYDNTSKKKLKNRKKTKNKS